MQVRHVALRVCWEAAEVDDVAHAVASMLRSNGYARACLVAHSYGTFVVSRFCQLYPEVRGGARRGGAGRAGYAVAIRVARAARH